MKIGKSILMFLLCAVCSPLLVSAQNQSVSEIIDHQVKNVEGDFVSAAEAMPEDKYSFAPTSGEFKGVRTFAQQVKHVAAVNYAFGAVILGEKPPVDTNDEKGPDSLQSKADIVNYLKNSFVYLHKAIASINDTNMATPMKNPFGGKNPVTRLGMAIIAAAHPWDHYGQMVVYLRMNGIVPPASR